jgi:glycosyltransferase involved in cell wall biosynthesis
VVTVIVPCFNYARFLGDCVGSLLRQTYRAWECVIVDDGSTDETPQVARELVSRDARLRYVRQDNAGLSAARNAGVREARGHYLQFLDADDMLEADKLAVQARFLEESPETDLVVGGAAYFSRSALDLRPWPKSIAPAANQAVLEALVRENLFPVNAALLRRSVLDSVGAFDPTLRAHEDWDLWLRCAVRGRTFAFVTKGNDRALIRQHAANMSASRQLFRRTPRETMRRTAIEVRERIHPALPRPLQRTNLAHLARARCALGVELMGAGRFHEGWALYRTGYRSAPAKLPALLNVLLLIPGASLIVRIGDRMRRAFGPSGS